MLFIVTVQLLASHKIYWRLNFSKHKWKACPYSLKTEYSNMISLTPLHLMNIYRINTNLSKYKQYIFCYVLLNIYIFFVSAPQEES